MANFLHLLVRVSVKVDPQLANRLKPLIDTILPQTTTVLLCIALLDCPNQPGNVVRSVAQLYVRKCNNSQVKDFLCGIHFHNPKSAILEQVFGPTSQEEILNPIDTHPTILPHNCCERTCCFVLANTTKTTVGNKNPTHSSIACNLTHAVDELQKLRNSGISSSSSSNGTRLLLSSDLNEIRALATKLNRLLEQFQCWWWWCFSNFKCRRLYYLLYCRNGLCTGNKMFNSTDSHSIEQESVKWLARNNLIIKNNASPVSALNKVQPELFHRNCLWELQVLDLIHGNSHCQFPYNSV